MSDPLLAPICPICLSWDNTTVEIFPSRGDGSQYRCERCTEFELTRNAELDIERDATNVLRAALSYRIATSEEKRPTITSAWAKQFLADARPAIPPVQAARLLRFIAEGCMLTGKDCVVDKMTVAAQIESMNSNTVQILITQMLKAGLIVEIGTELVTSARLRRSEKTYQPTFAGWEKYEAERLGPKLGKRGFMAMKFGDVSLDDFARDVIKPAVQEGTGYELLDLRNVARAGVIDNIMREQIRDAAFVLVDLTHDNSGAYWEAGYAEGLGKPVIYLCEKRKFDAVKTHFDTNHCTTVPWDAADPAWFRAELVATIRRSLNLFS